MIVNFFASKNVVVLKCYSSNRKKVVVKSNQPILTSKESNDEGHWWGASMENKVISATIVVDWPTVSGNVPK